jgi:hypothetical protein
VIEGMPAEVDLEQVNVLSRKGSCERNGRAPALLEQRLVSARTRKATRGINMKGSMFTIFVDLQSWPRECRHTGPGCDEHRRSKRAGSTRYRIADAQTSQR